MLYFKRIISWAKKELKLKNFLWLTAAGIVNAVGITILLSPVSLIDGGIPGTAMLISGFLPKIWGLPTFSVFLIILNFPFFNFGKRRQGMAFSIYSRYAIIVSSVTAWIITHWLTIDLASSSPIAGKDLLLCALFGGMISGAGKGITIRFEGALDGLDVMAVLFAKRLGITVGSFEMMYNVVLYVSCAFVTKTWILPLYSIVAYTVSLKTIDFFVEGLNRSKSVMIITEKPDAIISALTKEFKCGSTRISAEGGYSNTHKTIVYFVVTSFQLPKLRSIIKAVDEKAYVTVSDVADVIKMNQNKCGEEQINESCFPLHN